jgi:hypothetical protein
MLKDYYEYLTFILNKKRDSLLGIASIFAALFGNLPKPVTIFLFFLLAILFFGLFKEALSVHKIFREKHIPIVLLAGRNDDEYESMISDVLQTMKEYRFDRQSFEDDFYVDKDSYIIRRENNLSENQYEWETLAHSFENKIIKLSAKLKGRKVFHIFLNCPAALAVGLGSVIGTKYEVVLHHYQKGSGSNPYHPVIDFYSLSTLNQDGVHILKSRVNPPYQFIRVEETQTLSSIVLVSLFLAGHDLKGDVEKISNERSTPAFHIRSTMEGTIPLNVDWLRVSREVASYLLNLTSNKEIENLELYLSCPIILAFAIGMTFGTQTPFITHLRQIQTKTPIGKAPYV